MRYLIALGLALSSVLASAQPMAIGPPPNRLDTSPSLPVRAITGIVRERAQKTVDETNARLKKKNESTRVSVEAVKVFPPGRSSEVTLNQPNSWFVRIPYIITIKVDINNSPDRRIHIPIDAKIFCDNWYTQSGTLVARSEPGPASIEGGSIFEEILTIRDDIDAAVRRGFSPPMATTVPLGGRCTTIGAYGHTTETVNDDIILWDTPPSISHATDNIAKPTIEVTFDRLKRLRARRLGNAILYQEREDIRLHAFANYVEAEKALSMREEDDVALNLPVIRLDAGKFENLVIIGNIEQPPYGPPYDPKDSTSAASTRAQRYAPGTHVLQIPKWYVMPPDQFSSKPQWIRVPAYELTYTVRFKDIAGSMH